MQTAAFSDWLEQVTQRQHPYYHPIQISLFASLSYIGTACLTSISPTRGATLTVLAYAISQFITPFFVELFEPYQDIPLAPLAGQVLQITFSFILAKTICNLVGQSLSFTEGRQVSIVFLISLFVSRFALLKFRQALEVSKG